MAYFHGLWIIWANGSRVDGFRSPRRIQRPCSAAYNPRSRSRRSETIALPIIRAEDAFVVYLGRGSGLRKRK